MKKVMFIAALMLAALPTEAQQVSLANLVENGLPS